MLEKQRGAMKLAARAHLPNLWGILALGGCLLVPTSFSRANVIADCKRTLLKEGLRYCNTVRRALVRCTHRNLKAEEPVDCLTDERVQTKDIRAEIRARARIRQSCVLVQASQLGFPNELCPQASDFSGIENCLWEAATTGAGGAPLPGALRSLCFSSASYLDVWIQQPGGYPEDIPTVRKCRDSLLKDGVNFADSSSKVLANCEDARILEGLLSDCVSSPAVLSREVQLEGQVVEKVEEACAYATPEQLGYPTPECNEGGQAPPDIAAVIDCLWRTPTSRGIRGVLREAGYAAVHALVPPVCGNGVLETFSLITRGEQCDDGNGVEGDCCDTSCDPVPAGSPCDDLNPCTTGDQCDGNGICVGTAGGCAGPP